MTILDPVSRKYIAVYARRKSTYSWTIEKKKKVGREGGHSHIMRAPAHSQGHIFGQPIPAFPLPRLENKGEIKSSLVSYGYFECQRMIRQ